LYLSRELNLEVHAVTIDTGGFSAEDLASIRQRALDLGCASFSCIDEKENYYQSCIRFLIFGNVLRNNTYPLSVSAERVQQATAIAQFAKKQGASAVAHGSTGAGNDQVRFDLIFQQLCPELQIITPVRDQKLSRQDEITYIQSAGFKWAFEKAAYSINKGLWGTSVGGKETLKSREPLPESAFPTALTATTERVIALQFMNGELKKVDNQDFESSVSAIQFLNDQVSPYAIGRDIHIGDTIIGIKGRVGFEAAAPLIIIKAHHALEKHVLSKWQLFLKDQLSAWYGTWLHEGQFFDPVMRDIEAFFLSSQVRVTGTVYVQVQAYRFQINGIESKHDLMSSEFGSYGEENKTWTGEDVKGFTKIFGNSISIYHQVNKKFVENAEN
jgi:argininosuccinate synthase